jgi:AcrR family transcriptional regulator
VPKTRGKSDGGGAPARDDGDVIGWQQRALDRSQDEARRRILERSNAFVQAAKELVDETGTLNFTVDDVVARAELSIRSFYEIFSNKEEFLLALFEDYVATAAEWQRQRMSRLADPLDQIRTFVTDLWAAELSPEVVRALALYSQTLSASRPADLAHALEPQLAVLREAIDRGVEQRKVRTDIDSGRLSEILLHTANAAVHTNILATGSESPDDVWAFCRSGIEGPA